MDLDVRYIKAANELVSVIQTARASRERGLPVTDLLAICDAWSRDIVSSECGKLSGAVFLSLWLKRNSLESLLTRELGDQFVNTPWRSNLAGEIGAFPVGVVGHWPAANVEILPFLSAISSVLGGNACLVRVPSDLVGIIPPLLKSLSRCENGNKLLERMHFVSFDHGDAELQGAMAREVDGAMIWGGWEAVNSIRTLPFRPHIPIKVFGPRISVCAMDKEALRENERRKWFTRLARDLWQFEQQACSSPQVLFIESDEKTPLAGVVGDLKKALQAEHEMHPRKTITASLATSIIQARANHFVKDERNTGVFPFAPHWSILLQWRPVMPKMAQGKTLYVIPLADLRQMVRLMDPDIQTVGLGIGNKDLEADLKNELPYRGVDRLVRIGTMHVFDSPWDGVEMVSSMVRKVRFSPSYK